MRYDKYYDARKIVEEIIEKDLLGPVEDEEIICGERPSDYYILGKLYPLNSSADVNNSETSTDDCGNIDSEDSISLCNNNKPSSFGVSICLNKDSTEFIVFASAAKYIKLSSDEAMTQMDLASKEMPKTDKFWKRTPTKHIELTINANELKIGRAQVFDIDDHLKLNILAHRVMQDKSRIITISLINNFVKNSNEGFDDSSKMYFQPKILIKEVQQNSFNNIVHRKELSADRDIRELNMLYQHIDNYASGHGCAVSWKAENNLITISSEFLPKYEVLQMKPSSAFSGEILSMNYLATASRDNIKTGLTELVNIYEAWISDQENKIASTAFLYPDIGRENLEKCRNTSKRITNAIDAFADPKVFEAFQLANRAMYEQRKNNLIINGKYTPDTNIAWYPFQLAFFLQEIVSFADPKSDDRKIVDLLWFPTGGGKTEAYLGIAAFCIFLRRIRHGADGVTVLMRYTMRLLTFQQFERASALICACELIRQEKGLKGGEIGIGLWAGQALTPNKIEIAEKILNGEIEANEETGNPVQITKCPWCGSEISKDDYCCNSSKKRLFIKCPNDSCSFNEGLPIHLIDEDIYHNTPTYIVATIDKFAQIALNEECAALFGSKVGKLPPELIIQDELHLISGPLGTITGLYEAAIKRLCENNNVEAKVIASTATIRNAKDQIKALYASDYSQFPPQGININDSFFAVESSRDDKPARLYLGCMGIGTSPTTMMIRTMSAMLYGSRYLFELDELDENIIDAYWTLTGYFNTLRELGGALIRVVDDIQDRFRYLRNSKFSKKYPMIRCDYRYDKYKELTSREKSEDIGKVIQKELPIKFTKDGSTYPYDFVLASNMISVGVDVGRLGGMVVVGQPKSTAEYIQATSRVGRENPGIVLTTYNQAKSRDRSHYEQFYQYHSSFYKYVEATSITPFADRARDRALQTLYIILCRYFVSGLFGDKDAKNYKKSLPELVDVRKYIFDYVSIVDPDELENVKAEINEIEEEWEDKASRRDELRYRYHKHIDKNSVLFAPDYEDDNRFRVLNTMRSVETTVEVKVRE